MSNVSWEPVSPPPTAAVPVTTLGPVSKGEYFKLALLHPGEWFILSSHPHEKAARDRATAVTRGRSGTIREWLPQGTHGKWEAMYDRKPVEGTYRVYARWPGEAVAKRTPVAKRAPGRPRKVAK